MDQNIDPTSKRWQVLANQLARGYCPPIRPCKDCSLPVIQGYCCTFCGSVDPEPEYPTMNEEAFTALQSDK